MSNEFVQKSTRPDNLRTKSIKESNDLKAKSKTMKESKDLVVPTNGRPDGLMPAKKNLAKKSSGQGWECT